MLRGRGFCNSSLRLHGESNVRFVVKYYDPPRRNMYMALCLVKNVIVGDR